MTLKEITEEFNDVATRMSMPTLAITDCKAIDEDYDEELDKTVENCCFPHYYKNGDGVEYDLVFDDYGDHGYWNLYDASSNDLIRCDENPQAILDEIER